MVEILAAHKQALEIELQERVRAFFESNDNALESVSIEMKLTGTEGDNSLSTIHILVKDACTDTPLIMV